jgi:hypothetical protein
MEGGVMPGTRRHGTAGSRRRQRALGVTVAALVLLATLAAAALAASTDFRQPATSPEQVGIGPVGIVAADLDGDTDKDLAVTNLLTTGNVTILLNNGSGKFTQPASSPESAGNDPVSIAAADLNGDGDRDLAVANQQSFNVTILRNTGSGDFTEPPSSPESAGTFPQGIVTGNLDGVGRPDLAVANQGSDDVTILLNIGSHDFTQPVTSPETVGDRPFTLAAADFDGDGFGDLAVPNHDIDNVTILHNVGSGDFAEPGTSPEGAGDGPHDVAAGDLDGDTDPDLAVANNFDSTVTILRNR